MAVQKRDKLTGKKAAETNKMPGVSGGYALYRIAFTVLLILLFYPPYFRGLFFTQEQLWTLIAAAVIFLLAWQWKVSSRDLSFLETTADYCALAIPLLYILAVFWAASQSLAVYESVKYLIYFFVYWLVAFLSCDNKKVKLVLTTLYLTSLGVALAGIGAALGWITYRDAFVSGRIFSTLQYPNATAVFLGAGLILGFYLANSRDGISPFLYTPGNYLLLVAFLGTNSRGGFLIFPLALAFFWLGAGKFRRRLLVQYTGLVVAAGVGSYKFIPSVLAGQNFTALIWLLFGLLISVGVPAVILAYGKITWGSKKWAAGGLVVLAILIGTVMVLPGEKTLSVSKDTGQVQAGLLEKILPQTLLQRIKSVSLEDNSSQSRIYWSGDAMKMIIDHPFLGNGGGAWEAGYRKYQGYLYNSTQVHNHWLQVWTEVGSVGLLLWLGLWAGILWTAWQNYRRLEGENALGQWAVVWAMLFIAGHGFIDFDLSLGAVSVMLWALFGITSAKARNERQHSTDRKLYQQYNNYARYGSVCVALLLVIAAASLLTADYYAAKGVASARVGESSQAEKYFSKSVVFNPFNGNYRMDLARLNFIAGNNSKGITLMESAMEQESSNWSVFKASAGAYAQRKEWDKAAETMEREREAFPWNVMVWEDLIQMYDAAGLELLQGGRLAEARSYLQSAAAVEGQMREKMNSLGEKERRLWQGPAFEITPKINLFLGIANYLLGEDEKARHSLTAAVEDNDLKRESLIWLAALEDRKGEGHDYLDQLLGVDQEALRDFNAVVRLPVFD